MRIGALEGGGTKMVLAVCNENGEVLDRVSIPTETPEITMPKMIAYFKEQQVEALGIGFFGPVILKRAVSKVWLCRQYTKACMEVVSGT